ncbi:MAG: aldo/keto reductase [Frankiales bacterium]|nr:aldo/keto reductase [Frankiales bacterium]
MTLPADAAGTFPLGPAPVRRLGYGAMQLAGPGVFGPPRDRDAAVAVLRRAVELGVDHVDTSQYYGPDVVNDLLREVLHPYDGVALVSKVGAKRGPKAEWLPWDRPEDLRQGIEDNLRALGVERLRAVNLRVMDPGHGSDVPFDEQVDAMVQAREDGLIEGVGLSNVSAEQLTQALARTEVVCVQNPYNVVDRASQPVVDLCGERGIAFVPFFPLGSGFGVDPVLTTPSVTATAQRLGCTPAQVALAWILATVPHALLIPGTGSVGHLEENLAAGTVELDEQALTDLG